MKEVVFLLLHRTKQLCLRLLAARSCLLHDEKLVYIIARLSVYVSRDHCLSLLKLSRSVTVINWSITGEVSNQKRKRGGEGVKFAFPASNKRVPSAARSHLLQTRSLFMLSLTIVSYCRQIVVTRNCTC